MYGMIDDCISVQHTLLDTLLMQITNLFPMACRLEKEALINSTCSLHVTFKTSWQGFTFLDSCTRGILAGNWTQAATKSTLVIVQVALLWPLSVRNQIGCAFRLLILQSSFLREKSIQESANFSVNPAKTYYICLFSLASDNIEIHFIPLLTTIFSQSSSFID